MIRYRKFSDIRADQKGATAVEYGLIMALMTLALIGAVASTGAATQDKWEKVADDVGAAMGNAGSQ